MLRTILLLDGSAVMNSAADYLPSYCLALRTPILHCVAEYLDSTPLATMGVVVMRDGVSRRLSPCTSNGAEIAEALEREYFLEGGSGALSFENGLRMALSEIVDLRKVRAIATGGKPSHDPTRLRVLVISASVTLIDPADVFAVLKLMAQVHIEVHCVSLCGAVHVFEEAARMTGGTMHCPLNYGHLQSILRHLALQLAVEGRGHRIAREQTKRQRLLARKRARGNGEPRDESSDAREGTEMIPIGFPLYVAATTPARDVVVKEEVPPKGAPPSATPETATTKNAAVYMLCPQCHLIQTAVPTTCRLCRLQLCSVPVLYSSFVRHSPFAVLAPTEAASGHRGCRRCSTCQRAVASSSVAEEGPVKTTSDEVGHDGAATTKGPVQCSACACWRCAECDVFVKEQLGLCPTCLASL